MPDWHGYVTHVPSGERRSWRVLSEVADFMQERLDETRTATGGDTT